MAAKAGHTNMMTDTIIANLPPEALRSTLRGLLGGNAPLTAKFNSIVSDYLISTKPTPFPELFVVTDAGFRTLPALQEQMIRYRCLMGCGKGVESLCEVLNVVAQLKEFGENLGWEDAGIMEKLADIGGEIAGIDGDVVQAVTAVHKELIVDGETRAMEDVEIDIAVNLVKALRSCQDKLEGGGVSFERAVQSVETLLKSQRNEQNIDRSSNPRSTGFKSTVSKLEAFKLGDAQVPRIFCGLWQFSSPAWGTATKEKIHADFRKHVDAGLIAYDMADHYGDAEATFGGFRSSQADSASIFCATKWCVFNHIQVSKDLVDSSINERLSAINATEVELLQFHWQDYDDHQYVEAAKLIEANPHVRNLGLCNFDTVHMNEMLDSGMKVVSNQVQFSLIDLRPTFLMAESCRKHGVKLLTYGSLCGGFLAEKWFGKSMPGLFDKDMTPSHRKYLEMITIWGGWPLFQELLAVLRALGQKYKVTVSNVAVRWILDHDFVGAVIVGSRMGISEHIEENLKVFSFGLEKDDQELIGQVLERSNAKEVFEAMGDCGAEYR
ncbi:NAD(P)-linked oxidoreductase [Glarea lozoyensis ATCC 20868]|uniref:NAD(P)-linked oxidoreductase n=1 Tax=Glarea lozoyensis (strain ATCC 20868 / MF5171) TaxID=1116229 RepID=S3DP35_GLAL2|nr:NAD(P)-linked oxidoreductase [Glarea lozoyensis ATCC 20868]EPE28223.1 NAD(P)-linked oxidoreductase [Glarea lozoyensis ATCC 20868]